MTLLLPELSTLPPLVVDREATTALPGRHRTSAHTTSRSGEYAIRRVCFTICITFNALANLLTPDEAARVLRTSGEHVRALLRSGALGGFRLSDGPRARFRIPRGELERFVAERQTREGE